MQPYVFRYRDLDPAKMKPLGDRYLVEVLEVEEEQTPTGLFLPSDRMDHGTWAIGVVCAVGNGHRLEVSDHVAVIPEGYQAVEGLTQEEQMARRANALSYMTPAMGDHSTVMRPLATVPMFHYVGDVLFLERYSGRQFTVGGRLYRFVSQVDVLGFTGLHLCWSDAGEWCEWPQSSAGAPVAS
jgi:co-chaperonin GroES (HSP10)